MVFICLFHNFSNLLQVVFELIFVLLIQFFCFLEIFVEQLNFVLLEGELLFQIRKQDRLGDLGLCVHFWP